MRKAFKIAIIGGLDIRAYPNAVQGSILMWFTLSAIGLWVLKLPAGSAVFGGLLATLLHIDSEFWHQLGHAFAARRTGYPMMGITYWWALAASRYPRNEPELPAEIHIRRSLGGPSSSFLLALAVGGIAYFLRNIGGISWWLALFAFLDNLLVFTIGALLPLGFTDGSTLLYWWPKRGENKLQE
ncbi:MAG: hypothetical protein FVQ83_05495 [Chloroflexi bacterium]|nr:hypothetical protein [Chloroflexota bacterium]